MAEEQYLTRRQRREAEKRRAAGLPPEVVPEVSSGDGVTTGVEPASVAEPASVEAAPVEPASAASDPASTDHAFAESSFAESASAESAPALPEVHTAEDAAAAASPVASQAATPHFASRRELRKWLASHPSATIEAADPAPSGTDSAGQPEVGAPADSGAEHPAPEHAEHRHHAAHHGDHTGFVPPSVPLLAEEADVAPVAAQPVAESEGEAEFTPVAAQEVAFAEVSTAEIAPGVVQTGAADDAVGADDASIPDGETSGADDTVGAEAADTAGADDDGEETTPPVPASSSRGFVEPPVTTEPTPTSDRIAEVRYDTAPQPQPFVARDARADEPQAAWWLPPETGKGTPDPSTGVIVMPDDSFEHNVTGPLDETGEVLLTGTISLPSQMSSTGVIPTGFEDNDEVDDHGYAIHTNNRPVSVSDVVAESTSGRVLPQARSSRRVTIILSVIAGVLVLAAAGMIGYYFIAGGAL